MIPDDTTMAGRAVAGGHVTPARPGFAKRQMPPDLFEKVRAFLDVNVDHAREEHVPGGYVRNAGRTASDVVELPDALRSEIQARLRPICEAWCGQELEPTSVYGIRRYYRGTTLAVHRDRAVLVISAILNIAQDVEEPWPLVIEENTRTHRCFLQPGEMLLYEGARLPHGRPDPLVGKHYSNVFVHYQPKPCAIAPSEPTALKVFPAALSDDACDRIIREAAQGGLPADHWVNAVLGPLTLLANDTVWRYDRSAVEGMQFTFDDRGKVFFEQSARLARKLSVIVNLSGPDDYEGGDLLIEEASGTHRSSPPFETDRSPIGSGAGALSLLFPPTSRSRFSRSLPASGDLWSRGMSRPRRWRMIRNPVTFPS